MMITLPKAFGEINMNRFSLPLGGLAFSLSINLIAAPSPQVLRADLKPATLAAYSRYVQLTDARTRADLARPNAFLYVDGLPASRRAQVQQQLRRGEIFMAQLETVDRSGDSIDVPGGLIHHWLGAVFIPGAKVKQAIDLAQDYAHHQEVYKPEIVSSRLLSHNGNDFKVYYRVRKHAVLTVTLNTEHDVRFFQVDSARWYSRSNSTRITEVENAGQPSESAKPAGHDGGFLWRIDSWWRWEERDGGVYVESESVSLTRDIPTGLGWIVRPFVTSIPKESLQNTLGSTLSALLTRAAAAEKH